MDEDIMSRSSYGKVIFNTVDWTTQHLTCKLYPKYIYDDKKTSVSASVGLYRILKNNPDEYIIKQDIFIVPQTLGEDIQLEFERSKLPLDEKSFYHFQFINEDGEVMGASTPFKIRNPPSPTESHESDEFVVIDQDLKYESEIPEIKPESINPSSFVVLSEQCKSLEIKEESKSVISDSMSSLTESLNVVQPSEISDETDGVQSTSSHQSLLNFDEKKEEAEKEETIQIPLEEWSNLKDQLQNANETIQNSEKQIHQLQEELQNKDKEIKKLKKCIEQQEAAQQPKDFIIQEFQTLHKQDQFRIYELESKMKEEMKQNNGNHSNFPESVSELGSVGEEFSMSLISESSFKNLESSVIQNFSNESVHKVILPKDEAEDKVSQETIEAASLSSKSESIPRILDDGRVVIVNNCPICGMEFDASAEDSLTIHVNNHLPTDCLECPMCDLKFEIGQQSDLEEHVQIHLDEDSEDDMEGVEVIQKESGGSQGSGSSFGAVKNVLQFLNTLGK